MSHSSPFPFSFFFLFIFEEEKSQILGYNNLKPILGPLCQLIYSEYTLRKLFALSFYLQREEGVTENVQYFASKIVKMKTSFFQFTELSWQQLPSCMGPHSRVEGDKRKTLKQKRKRIYELSLHTKRLSCYLLASCCTRNNIILLNMYLHFHYPL